MNKASKMVSSNCIETLEGRIAPASLVNVTYNPTTGVLDVAAGDGAAHNVNIFKTGKDTYRIEDGGGTDIDVAGVAFMDIIGKVTSLTVTGGADVDNYVVSEPEHAQNDEFQRKCRV
jgi:hypothetical protein